jgi:hypothetical protein
MKLFGLSFFVFLTGFLDSMVGGGGLIQLPALFIFFPHTQIAAILGTNELPMIYGTTAAGIYFIKEVKLDLRTVFPF